MSAYKYPKSSSNTHLMKPAMKVPTKKESKKKKVDFRNINVIHSQFLVEATEKDSNTDQYETELAAIENELKVGSLSGSDYREKTMRKKELQRRIEDSRSKRTVSEYILRNSDILAQYYERIPSQRIADIYNNGNADETILDKNRDLYQQFMNREDKTFLGVSYHYEDNTDMCSECGNVMSRNTSEGIAICENCGASVDTLLSTESSGYNENMTYVDKSNYAYKKINHLSEILNRAQARYASNLSKEHYLTIKDEIRRMRVDVEDLNQGLMRNILRDLKMNKFYDSIPHIINKLQGREPKMLSQKDEQAIKDMFVQMQPHANTAISKHPTKRKNFLSYPYVIHKICELLELDDFLHLFPYLKNSEKLRYHDEIWAVICDNLNWQFIPSER